MHETLTSIVIYAVADSPPSYPTCCYKEGGCSSFSSCLVFKPRRISGNVYWVQLSHGVWAAGTPYHLYSLCLEKFQNTSFRTGCKPRQAVNRSCYGLPVMLVQMISPRNTIANSGTVSSNSWANLENVTLSIACNENHCMYSLCTKSPSSYNYCIAT